MAGGDNAVGGNGSVYWRASHYGDKQGRRRLKCKEKGQPHRNDEIDVDEDHALGRDEDTAVEDVGRRLGQAGYFRVTLRYRTMADARAAGDWVAQNVQPGEGGFLLSIRVPAIKRARPNEDPPFEVMVEW